jgi:hypothetical protein
MPVDFLNELSSARHHPCLHGMSSDGWAAIARVQVASLGHD